VATSTGPYAVALGTVLQLAPAQASGVYFSVVQIANSSPFLATVMVGGNQFLLQPFMADLYTLPTGGQPVSAAFSQAPGGPSSAPGSTGSFCTATWYLPSDQITDAFPVALTAAAIMSALYTGPGINLTGDGGNLGTTGFPTSYFGPTGPTIVRWAMITIAIAAATVQTAGVLAIYLGSVGPGGILLPLYVPFEPTFTPCSQTVPIIFPAGGVSCAGGAPGAFSLEGLILSGAMTAINGYVYATIGY
jgi:hypothetical protein